MTRNRIHHWWALSTLVLLGLGCDGREGAEGPVGPPGNELSLDIRFETPRTALPADGTTTYDLEILVTANGAYVGNQSIEFEVVTGDGRFETTRTLTDLVGRATTRYRAGHEVGPVTVVALARGELLTRVDDLDLHLDPPTLHAPFLEPGEIRDPELRWSPDGARVTISSGVDPAMFVVDVAGGTRTEVGPYQGGLWNPDGSDRLLVRSDEDVLVVAPDGTVLAGPDAVTNLRRLCWTSDGDSLLAMGFGGTYLYDADLSGSRPLDVDLLDDVVSLPDGDFLGVDTDLPNQLRRVHRATGDVSAVVTLTSRYLQLRSLSLSPDGERVVVSGYDLEDWDGIDLFVVDLESTDLFPLFVSTFAATNPRWSPDGSTIAFTSARQALLDNVHLLPVGGTAAEGARR